MHRLVDQPDSLSATLLRGSLLFSQGLAGDQAYSPPLIAYGIVEHVVGFVIGIPDERDLVGVLLVQPGGISAGLVEWFGVGGPVNQVTRISRHDVRVAVNPKVEHHPVIAVTKDLAVRTELCVVTARAHAKHRVTRIALPVHQVG